MERRRASKSMSKRCGHLTGSDVIAMPVTVETQPGVIVHECERLGAKKHLLHIRQQSRRMDANMTVAAGSVTFERNNSSLHLCLGVALAVHKQCTKPLPCAIIIHLYSPNNMSPQHSSVQHSFDFKNHD